MLAARNADEPVAPASLTKMMTLYLTFRALEAGQLELVSQLKVSSRAAAMPPTKLGLKAGVDHRGRGRHPGPGDPVGQRCRRGAGRGLGGSEDRFAR